MGLRGRQGREVFLWTQFVDVQAPVVDQLFPDPPGQHMSFIAFERQIALPADVVEVMVDGLQVAAALRQHLHHDLWRTIDREANVVDLRGRQPISRTRSAARMASDVQQRGFFGKAKRSHGPQRRNVLMGHNVAQR
jgi:hypothetical protein